MTTTLGKLYYLKHIINDLSESFGNHMLKFCSILSIFENILELNTSANDSL